MSGAVIIQSPLTPAGERIIEPMIDRARCSKLKRIIVPGSRSPALMFELHRRGYVRVAMTTNCGFPAGQYDVALVDWRYLDLGCGGGECWIPVPLAPPPSNGNCFSGRFAPPTGVHWPRRFGNDLWTSWGRNPTTAFSDAPIFSRALDYCGLVQSLGASHFRALGYHQVRSILAAPHRQQSMSGCPDIFYLVAERLIGV